MTKAILPQGLPVAASADNREYARQADGRTLRPDRSKCFRSPYRGCSNCEALCAVETLVERAHDYAEASHAENTRRTYCGGWSDFSVCCGAHGFQALPAAPQTVALYVTGLAQRAKVATIRTYLAAIAQRHREKTWIRP